MIHFVGSQSLCVSWALGGSVGYERWVRAVTEILPAWSAAK